MTSQLRKETITNGQVCVYKEKANHRGDTIGYIKTVGYCTTTTDVWSVIHLPGTNHQYADRFRDGKHAAKWILALIQPHAKRGKVLIDEQTWRNIHKIAPGLLPAFREATGQDWKPEAEQAELL